MIIAQLIIFLLGWPLEWTEIIVIFCPIFIPLLSHFDVDPILFGTMVAVNLQAAFLSPPVAMSAFYLKGVAPKHVTLNQIFAGMMPYMLIVIALSRVHVHLPGHDALAAGVPVRELSLGGGLRPPSDGAAGLRPACACLPPRSDCAGGAGARSSYTLSREVEIL